MTLLLISVFLIVIMMLLSKGGAWDNMLTWVNIILSGLFAMNYFEPFANYLTENAGKDFHWYWDFIGFWAIYCVAMLLLRMLTDACSRVKVKFRVPVEWGISGVFAVLSAWTMVCIVTFSLHLAPTQMTGWSEAFMTKPDDTHFFGADYMWLSFAHRMSDPEAGPLAKDEQHVFDQDGVFRVKYALRRYRHELLPNGANKGPSPVP